MEIGISTASLFGRHTTEESLEIIQEMGARKCEVFLCTFFEYRYEFGLILKDKIKDIEVHSIHALNTQFEPQLFNRYPRTVQDAERILNDVCKVGEILGAKYLTFHGPTSIKKNKRSYNYKHLGDVLNNINKIANNHKMSISYENVHWCFSSTPEYFKNLKEYLDNGIVNCLDIKQAKLANCDYKEFLDVFGNKIKTVHVCDYDDDLNLLLPGRGSFNFRQFFGDLKNVGYDGPIMIEAYSETFGDEKDLQESFDYLKEELKIALK